MTDFSREELLALKAELSEKYRDYKSKNLALDMSRGKPSNEQLDLSNGILDALSSDEYAKTGYKPDYRNYGILFGIPECRELFADILAFHKLNRL